MYESINMETLDLLRFLQDTLNGKGEGLTEEAIEQAGVEIQNALRKQFNAKRSDKFRLRASNIGKPYCKLWHEKNKTPEIPLTPQQLMNFVLGDAVEVIYLAVLRSIYKDNFIGEQAVTVNIAGQEIKGHTDLSIAGFVHDVKSASPWSFNNKFQDTDSLKRNDSYGYVPQLLFYSRGGAGKLGGFYVLNKQNGEVKFVKMDLTADEEDRIWRDLEDKVRKLESDAPFERGFDDVPEVFRRQPTGNRVLQKVCTFCEYRNTCWTNLQVRPQIPSAAKFPRDEFYTHIEWEGDDIGS